jgi:hypothetical protein
VRFCCSKRIRFGFYPRPDGQGFPNQYIDAHRLFSPSRIVST